MIHEAIMKYLFFFYSLLYLISSHSYESFSGFILTQGQHRILKTETSQYSLSGSTTEINNQIAKLNDNDFISGVGEPKTNNLILQSIDFIGLNQFLGFWISPMGILQVKDFSRLNIYVPNRPIPIGAPKTSLNYSITPGQGNSWVLFLSDESQIYYSNLFMSDSKALIRFYNTQTGAFIKEVTMSKLVQ